MVSINEELKTAKAAKAAINVLLTATLKSPVLGTLYKAKNAASYISPGGALNRVRVEVRIALSSVMHGLPTLDKIDRAKRAIDVWIRELEAAKAKLPNRQRSLKRKRDQSRSIIGKNKGGG